MMKKFLFAVCSICIAASAASAPLSAFAAGHSGAPEYPDVFNDLLSFENLTDFAIANENKMVFADGQTIARRDGENVTYYNLAAEDSEEGETADVEIIVDYDAANQQFFYSPDGGITSYVLPDSPDELPGTPQTHRYETPYAFLERDIFSGYHYYYQGQGDSKVLCVLDENETSQDNTTRLWGFANAKVYGNQLYAINDNCLYSIVGSTTELLSFTFSNFGKLNKILTGDIPDKLNTYATFEDNPQFVLIEEDAMLTEIDLNNPARYNREDDEYYLAVVNPEVIHTASGELALLLYKSKSLDIVAYGRSAYIIKADGATELEMEYNIKTPIADGTTASVIVAGEYAHALPFMCNATRNFALAPNEIVKVLYEVSDDELAHKFYIIENAAGERGYVVDEFLGDFNVPVPDEGGASTTPDPDPHTDSYLKTVVLIIVVVVLVLTAVAYLTWLGTQKHKKADESQDGEIDLRNNDDKKRK